MESRGWRDIHHPAPTLLVNLAIDRSPYGQIKPRQNCDKSGGLVQLIWRSFSWEPALETLNSRAAAAAAEVKKNIVIFGNKQ